MDAFVELSAVDLRFAVTASDVEQFATSVSGVADRRLLTTCGNFLPLPGDITSTPPRSVSCPTRELLRRGINARPPGLPPCSVGVVSTVVVEPFCRLAAPASACLAAARLTDPGADGAGIDDDDDLADFTLELPAATAGLAAAVLAARLSGWALELTRRARPDERRATGPPPVVELLATLLMLVDDAVRLGTDDNDDRLPSHPAAAAATAAASSGARSMNISR